jgi:radical SAM superfamily enzyme YgiQ (UPF0313 family)
VLISTYNLGHQPFALASAAAWLRQSGVEVTLVDLSLRPLDESVVRMADLMGVYLPMHTATRLAASVFRRLRSLNANARVCAFGLYAPLNEDFLRRLGVDSVIGGEFEETLARLAQTVGASRDAGRTPGEPTIVLAKQFFKRPDRESLPPLSEYAYLTVGNDQRKRVGYTEASRGCKHRCRHCPVVPVYDGRFFVVQRDIVMSDIRQQVAVGAEHITFGDPDFFNGVGHAIALMRQLHDEFPALTYDVTIKIEHLLKHADALPMLRETGCLFVTSAVESVDDHVLGLLLKGHTRADFVRAVAACRAVGLFLSPTFVAFSPWLTLEGYSDLLQTIEDLDLIDHVAPIQLAIRLLIPTGSHLLELAEVRDLVGAFDDEALCYPWRHPDPRVDALHDAVNAIVQDATTSKLERSAVFELLRTASDTALSREASGVRAAIRPSTPVPQMSEPWYCCAEPTARQRDAY